MCGLSFSELAAIHILRSFAAVNNGAGDIYSSCVKQGMRPEICYTIPAETPAINSQGECPHEFPASFYFTYCNM